MKQQTARIGIAGINELCSHCKVETRLRLAPYTRIRRELFQTERVVALGMTDVTTGVARSLAEKARLHTALKEFIVELRGCLRRRAEQ